MNRTLTFEMEIGERTLWIEAEVSISDTGPMYSDQDGDFGPTTWEHEIDHLSVFAEQGTDIVGTLDAETQRKIKDEIEERVTRAI